MGIRNDRSLRFYNEVLDLDRLHYGIWLEEDELSLENLRRAQVRYEDLLVNKIPESTKTILDVGCGTGILSKRLLDLGFNVEGLSPDITQMTNFTENIKAPFHHMKFQELEIQNKYDCLIMSESAQYINMNKLLENSQNTLKEKGYLMICDYFVKPEAKGKRRKSGHNIDEFMNKINDSNFNIIEDVDITDSVIKTLDIAKYAVDKVYTAIDIGTEKIRTNNPQITKFMLWLFRNKLKKLDKQLLLVNSEEFMKKKTYRFLLLQLEK